MVSRLMVRRLVGLAFWLMVQASFAADALWPKTLTEQRLVTETVERFDGGVQWADGARYWGSLEGVWPQGAGRLELPTGYLYRGEFQQGWLHGSGNVSGPQGQWYSGQWVKGRPSGYGQWRDALGNRYEGHWKGGKREGSGEFTWVSGSHDQGQWLDGQPNGLGRWTTSTGDRYVGDFQHGKPDGKGVMRWSDGTQYAGAFQLGEGHGEGHCVRDFKLMSCVYVEGVLTRAEPLGVEPVRDLSMIAVDNRDQSMVPIVLEQAFWQSFGAMVSRQIKIFTSAQLGQGLHFTVDDYTGPGRYVLGGGDIYAVLPVNDKTYEIGHLDKVRAVIDIVHEDSTELSGEFTVWGVEGDPEHVFSGVTFRNGQFRAVKWE